MTSSELGCFVYKVVGGTGIGVRRAPSTLDRYKTGRTFERGDLVSIDRVVTNDDNDSGAGPFLRLSDGSGWLFVKKTARDLNVLEHVEVQSGLWCFYVESAGGMALRNHPIDYLQTKTDLFHVPPKILPHMHKVYCDARVKSRNGVHFYRLQDTNCTAWIPDKREYNQNRGKAVTRVLLVPRTSVQERLFAYRAVNKLAVRSLPSASESSKTHRRVQKQDIVVGNLIWESPYKNGHGPFVRLVDGSGWLFVHKKWDKMMEPVPMERGTWRLKVIKPHRIRLRTQPVSGWSTSTNPSKKKDETKTILCDRRIQQGDACWYRQQGTNSWVNLDPTNPVVELIIPTTSRKVAISSSNSYNDEAWNDEAWTVDRVRTVARRGASSEDSIVSSTTVLEEEVGDVEAKLRSKLVDLEAQIQDLLLEKKALWKTVKQHEMDRFKSDDAMQKLQGQHKKKMQDGHENAVPGRDDATCTTEESSSTST